jgi:hypothetical protein
MRTYWIVAVVFLVPLGTMAESSPPGDSTRKAAPENTVWGPPAEGLRLSLRSTRTEYGRGQLVEVRIVIQNVDTNDQKVLNAHPLVVFDFTIKGPDAKFVSLTERGKQLEETLQVAGKRASRRLKPNETIDFGLALSDVYKLQEPGKYEIVASMQVPSQKDPKKWVTVTSNPLTITIATPKETKEK